MTMSARSTDRIVTGKVIISAPHKIPFIPVLALVYLLCSQLVFSAALNGFDLSDSIIPKKQIFSGGPPRDGIPALTDPEFVRAREATWLQDDNRILGVYMNGVAKAYPLYIMNWHEIVNDTFRDEPVLVTYCPLCGSGMAFDAQINGERHLFGVSGLLHNSDVLLYDRKTESLWSQIMSQAISGNYVSQKLEPVALENTTWLLWRDKYPQTLVLSVKTGYARDYNRDPYQSYRQSREIMFPVRFRAKGYHPKERVLGLMMDDQARAYPFTELSRTQGFFRDRVAGRDIFISFSQADQVGRILDADCNLLSATTLFWFAWYAFHPDTEVFKAETVADSVATEQCGE